jgi:hypothetical protein
MHNPVTVFLAPPADSSHATRLKIAASVLIALPAVLLLTLALGEIVGGDITGVQHIPEAGALLLILLAGWRYPRVAGVLLLVTGAAVFGIWLVLVLTQAEPAFRGLAVFMWIGVGLMFFAPPLVAGWILLKASEHRTATT